MGRPASNHPRHERRTETSAEARMGWTQRGERETNETIVSVSLRTA